MLKKTLLLIMIVLLNSCSKDENTNPGLDDQTGDPPTGQDPPSTDPNTPAIPTLKLPENLAICLPNDVTFTWETKLSSKVAIKNYVLEISKDPNFDMIIKSEILTGASKQMQLDQNTIYYWRVKTVGDNGKASGFSKSNQFYTSGTAIENSLPLAPTVTRPLLNSIVTAGSVTLQWTASDPDTDDSLTYDVYLDTANPPIKSVALNIGSSSHITSTLTGTQYYWQVIAKDQKGGITKGQIWKFRTNLQTNL